MLTPTPARTDLTDRECTKIIGGILGGLIEMVDDIETIRTAVRWWAETDEAWKLFELVKRENRKARNALGL